MNTTSTTPAPLPCERCTAPIPKRRVAWARLHNLPLPLYCSPRCKRAANKATQRKRPEVRAADVARAIAYKAEHPPSPEQIAAWQETQRQAQREGRRAWAEERRNDFTIPDDPRED